MLEDAKKYKNNILEYDQIKFAPMYNESDLSEVMTLEEFKKMLDE